MFRERTFVSTTNGRIKLRRVPLTVHRFRFHPLWMAVINH